MLGFYALAVTVAVTIAVAVAVCATRSFARIPAVQHGAEDSRSVFREPLAGDKRGFAHRMTCANHEHNAVGESAEESRISEMHHRWSVDDDHVEIGTRTNNNCQLLHRPR